MNEEIEKRFEEIEKRLILLEEKKEVEKNLPIKEKSPKEFILDKKPNKDVQTTLCIAYYIEKYAHKERFTSKDISEFFKKAKLPVPKKLSDKIYKCSARGLLAEDNKGEYYVTSSGEVLVENNFEVQK